VKPKLKKERKRPPKKWKRKKRKRETPQKEWQAKCTRTRARAHIVKKNFPDKTKQNRSNSKESSTLFGKYDGWQFVFDSLKTE